MNESWIDVNESWIDVIRNRSWRFSLKYRVQGVRRMPSPRLACSCLALDAIVGHQPVKRFLRIVLGQVDPLLLEAKVIVKHKVGVVARNELDLDFIRAHAAISIVFDERLDLRNLVELSPGAGLDPCFHTIRDHCGEQKQQLHDDGPHETLELRSDRESSSEVRHASAGNGNECGSFPWAHGLAPGGGFSPSLAAHAQECSASHGWALFGM